MLKGQLNIQISDLVYGLSSSLDLVSPALVNHHRQVLGFSAKLAEAFNLSDQEKSDICIAAMLHDIGVVAFNREVNLIFEDASINCHAELGYRLMKGFKPFASAAKLVRYHHRHHDDGTILADGGGPLPLGSGIIHLANWVASRLEPHCCVLSQAEDIRRWMSEESAGVFIPEVVEAFLRESSKECFWLDARYDTMPQIGYNNGVSSVGYFNLDMQGLKDLSELFRMIIDFRCQHTASHSRSVAHIAEALARLVGFSGHGCAKIYVAGNLHDLGKLSLPSDILNKTGPLTELERTIVKGHAYHSHRILKNIKGMEEICSWAALHHECPDGSGYPFRLSDDEIPLGAKIIAVADIFTALTETRPYRDGMAKKECLTTLLEMRLAGKLDPLLVSLVEKHYDDLFDLQMSVHREGIREYLRKAQGVIPCVPPRIETEKLGAVMVCG